MSFKRTIKKIIKNRGNDSIIGRAYLFAINRKRHNRYEKYSSLPVDSKVVAFEAFMGKKYTDSPKAIYEYMLSHGEYDDYSFVWSFRDSVRESFEFLTDNPRTKIIRWGSEEYYKMMAQAGYWITNTRIPNAIDIRAEQTYVQCWHGTPLKRLFCDIETEATESIETTRRVIHGDARRYTYMLSPSPFYTEKITSAFDLKALGKQDTVIETGYPRNDSILCYSQKKADEIKKQLGISAEKRVILYAPTYRENQRDENNKYVYKEPLKFDELKNALGDEYIVLFRAHYYIAEQISFEDYEGFIVDASDYPEINDLYIISDILVTDYSSVFFDYSTLKRPVIFYMYDLEFYRDKLRGFYLTLDELPGPIVQKQEDLVEKILSTDVWCSTEAYKLMQDEFVKRFAPYDDGHATERAVKKIIKEE